MKNTSIKRWILLVTLISIAVLYSSSILVYGVNKRYLPPKMDRKLSLKIELWEVHNGIKTKPISGVRSKIYRVADLSIKPGGVEYIVRSPYNEVRGSLEDITLSESIEIAKEYNKVANNPCYQGISDEDGIVLIDNMKAGMYLIVLKSLDEKEFSLYLISVPNYEKIDGGRWVYEVEMFPKAGKKVNLEKPELQLQSQPQPQPPKKLKIKTGDDTEFEFYALIIGISFMGIVAISFMKIENRKGSK